MRKFSSYLFWRTTIYWGLYKATTSLTTRFKNNLQLCLNPDQKPWAKVCNIFKSLMVITFCVFASWRRIGLVTGILCEHWHVSQLTWIVGSISSWEAESQEIACLYWTTDSLGLLYSQESVIATHPNQINPIQAPHSNIIFPSTPESPKSSLPFKISDKNFVSISLFSSILFLRPVHQSALLWSL